MKSLYSLLFLFTLGLTSAAQVPSHVPNDGLIAWYDMDGNLSDSSPQGHDGTAINLAPATDRYGADGGCLSFSGSVVPNTNRTQIANDAFGELPISDFFENGMTISIWALESSTSDSEFLQRRNNNSIDFTLGRNDDGGVATHMGFETFAGPGEAELDSWHHYALTYDEETIKLYIDGELSNFKSASQNVNGYANWVGLGKYTYYGGLTHFFFFNGLMDELGFWNRSLSQEEIEALFQSQENTSIEGCMDVTACNFNPDATEDDGNCLEAPFIAASGADVDSISTCGGESITLSAMGTTSALDSTLLDSFTMTVNSYYSRTTPILESGHTYRLIGNGRYGFADGWSHNDPAWNYAWDQETGTKVYCNGTQDASEDVRWLYDGAANFQRPDNDYHNNDNNAFCNGSDKTYAWTIEGDGYAHVISWEDCCYGDNSGSLDFWLYELTGVPGGPGTTWSTGDLGATTALTPSESQWVTLTTVLDGISLCQDSIWIEVVTSGCNDENACNYSMLDVCSVDCVYPLVGEDCEAGAVACAAGTVWDAESQTCVVATPAYLNEPGELAILNPCYFDSNANGLVEVTDLMNVLSVFGLACGEIPEAAEFTCGNPLSYQGYDYETVQIGEQCWFAENLRSTNYRNGDEIDIDLSLEDWSALNGGATSVYGEGESACNDDSPVIDSCDDALALLAFGRLYNGAAITDSRQLCPAGWGVPTDMAWTQLTDFLGGLASAGDALKSTENWYGGGNGTNDSGFDGEPGGYRNFLSEQFYNGGSSGYWWSQSPSGASELFIRSIDWNGNGSINVQSRSVQNSYSVRCLKSVE